MSEPKNNDQHPLDSIAKELVREVRDVSMKSWRAWLRGQNKMGAKNPDLRKQLENCHFNEEQLRFIWRMIFESSDYVMYKLMDYIDRSLDEGRFRIELYPKRDPADEDPVASREPEYTLRSSEELPGWFSDWSERFGEMSRDWDVEKVREPDRRY